MTPDFKNNRILLIDDNPSIHEDFKKILTGEDDQDLDASRAGLFGAAANAAPKPGSFSVESAFQGQEGLQRVEQACAAGRPFAMAFVDMRMPPGWDGVETVSKIWKVSPDLQVVICTAYSDYTLEDMIARLGRTDRFVILKKPFDNVEALQLANALTEKWRLLQQSREKQADLESIVRARTADLERANVQLQAEMAERQRAGEERQKIEVQLRAAQKLEAIGQLAAGIAHEINTPAQFIGDNLRFVRDSFADLQAVHPVEQRLLEAACGGAVPAPLVAEAEAARKKADVDYLHDEIPKALGQALEGVERVSRIVRAMKEFSHPGVGEKQNLDLNHAIETTIIVSRNEWKFVAEIDHEFDPALPAVPVLPGEFNQVVLNIIVNASHAIADAVGDGGQGKGNIHITTRRDGDWAEIRIRDSGTGIPEKARDRVFDPFFTTKGVGKGTGQGLAIAHSVVVDKHGGTIHFETEMGQGTTFVIRLPLVASASKEKKAA